MKSNILGGSFRDPAGYVFTNNGEIYRQINPEGKELLDTLHSSALYKALTEKGLLVSHEEVDTSISPDGNAFKVIKPQRIPFLSWPYEWCFSQLKAAALLTLRIQREAISHGMTLRDASAYNIQFTGYRPVFIDTLSFEPLSESSPWAPYRQFCQHFLAPLALMSYRDPGLNSLVAHHIDGVPLGLASSMLPFKSRLNLQLFIHLHLHANMQKRYASKSDATGNERGMGANALDEFIRSLETAVEKLKWSPSGTVWADYYDETNYSSDSFKEKGEIVERMFEQAGAIAPVWDMGANTGVFSRIAAKKGAYVVSMDVDPAAVEKNYLAISKDREENILPLVMDITNPSPSIGWASNERASLIDRGPTHTMLSLALVHHLAISNNLPLVAIARHFSELCENLIIEFVPKEDSQTQRLLAVRKDIFPDYNEQGFERAFAEHFDIVEKLPVRDTLRTMYLMRHDSGN